MFSSTGPAKSFSHVCIFKYDTSRHVTPGLLNDTFVAFVLEYVVTNLHIQITQIIFASYSGGEISEALDDLEYKAQSHLEYLDCTFWHFLVIFDPC